LNFQKKFFCIKKNSYIINESSIEVILLKNYKYRVLKKEEKKVQKKKNYKIIKKKIKIFFINKIHYKCITYTLQFEINLIIKV